MLYMYQRYSVVWVAYVRVRFVRVLALRTSTCTVYAYHNYTLHWTRSYMVHQLLPGICICIDLVFAFRHVKTPLFVLARAVMR